MDCLRTPDERFADLPGYPWPPHDLDRAGLRIHDLPEGLVQWRAWVRANPDLACGRLMQTLRSVIRNCPPPLVHAQEGRFLQEWGDEITRAAIAHWRLA